MFFSYLDKNKTPFLILASGKLPDRKYTKTGLKRNSLVRTDLFFNDPDVDIQQSERQQKKLTKPRTGPSLFFPM